MLLRRAPRHCYPQRRHASLCPAASASASTSTLPPLAPSPPSPPPFHPPYSEPSYLARYRDPAAHDQPLLRTPCGAVPKPRNNSTTASASASKPAIKPLPGRPSSFPRPPPEGSSSRTFDVKGKGKAIEGTPRSRRLEMERLWSGGEASPPIPLEPRVSLSGQPRHALLFPGSGSQYVGMGNFLKKYDGARKVWDEAEEALKGFEEWRRGLGLAEMDGEVGMLGRMLDETEGERLKEKTLRETVFEGPQDELTRSSNAQPAILVTSISFLRTLEDDLGAPVAKEAEYFLGHSSGEFTAAVASGAVSLKDGVRLIRLHGLLTTATLQLPSISLSSAPSTPPVKFAQMSALIITPGHSHQEVADIISSVSTEGAVVEVASYNSSSQVVLAGCREGILRACEVLRERGVASRAADLPVSAPFHCSFMKPTAGAMQIALDSVNIKSPSSPIISSLDGSLITTPTSLISNLVAQISLPVRWSHCLSTLRRSPSPTSRLIFLGPGKALANLAKRDAEQLDKEEGRSEGSGVVEEEVLSVATEDDLGRVSGIYAQPEVAAVSA
ncbi:[acyl-carrier-protein] S-malonyltransferase [Pseudohyphozyma bogoriensis]|nr:[acyl-carrier-protein] S-malonyltransferase [Pseudohyphozyma bogoriensis]